MPLACPQVRLVTGVQQLFGTVFMTPKPYLALVHSFISLPLALFYFTFIWIFVLVGGFTYYLFGLGVILLVTAASFIRSMTKFEIFMAKTMLSMGDRIAYPSSSEEGPALHDAFLECDFISNLYQASRSRAQRYKSKAGGMLTTDETHDEDDDSYDDEAQHYPISNSNTNTDTTHEIIEDDDETLPLAINSVRSGRSSLKVGSIQYQPSYGSANLLATSEYYEPYGALMSRSLDHDNYGSVPKPSISAPAQIVIIKRAPSREKNVASQSLPKPPNPALQYTPKKKKKSRRGSLGPVTNASPIKAINHTVQDSNLSDGENATSSGAKSSRSIWEQMKQLADGLRAYIFNQNTGFGLLYVVVKLPVSVVTFCATITLLAFIFGGFVPAVLHIMCNTNKYKICSSMLTSGEWYAWFVITIEGNTVCAIISVLLFTPCVYLLYTVTKLARDAIAVIGDDRDSSFS